MVRTRFAPSPTGFMHLGVLRTALYCYLYARRTGGKFLLRIEDTDQQRQVEGAEQVIYDTLAQTGLHYDEGPGREGAFGPYVQSQRRAVYRPYITKLCELGAAYPCFCTDGELEARRRQAAERGEVFKYDKHCLHLPKAEVEARLQAGEPHAYRLNVTPGETAFHDEVFGDIVVDNETLDDMVLLKSDGLPTYNFANIIDDHLMEITHIFRGSEFLSSTPKYLLVYKALGWQAPKFVHLSQIMKDQHRKLSKRYGDAYYTDFIAKGYLPEAILNYIALLGWNPGDNRELFTLPELEQAFSIERVNKSPALFDQTKMAWLNGEHIKRLPPETFAALAKEWLPPLTIRQQEILLPLLQSRVLTLAEIPEKLTWLTNVAPHENELYCLQKFKITPEIAGSALRQAFHALSQADWAGEAIHAALEQTALTLGFKNGAVLWPVRVALSGLPATPGGAVELAEALGKPETLTRLQAALNRFGGL